MIEHKDIVILLTQEKKELDHTIKAIKKSLSNSPKGSLHIHKKSENCVQYYLYKNTDEKKVYLPKTKMSLIKKLSQKMYDKELLPLLEKRSDCINRLLVSYNTSVFSIYENLSALRSALVDPVLITDDNYIKKWYDKFPGSQNSILPTSPHYTMDNEMVRSKSEVILTNLFKKHGIPYVYEPRLLLKDGKAYYPDFLLLNVRKRKTYLYEHLGMMDDPQYISRNLRKINIYADNGYILGNNFLCSFETSDIPLDEKAVEKMIITHFLNRE